MAGQDQVGQSEDETSLVGKIGCSISVLFLLLLLNGCAWFLTGKTQVVVLDDAGGPLHQGQEYFTTGEDYLLGLPAAMMRLTGMEPPARISGSGGTVDVAEVGAADSKQDIILINPTAKDIWYTAEVYGDDSSLSRGARTGTTRVPAGTGAVVVGKTHGELRFGCENRPLENETFAMGSGDSRQLAVLAWIAEQPPEQCNNGNIGR